MKCLEEVAPLVQPLQVILGRMGWSHPLSWGTQWPPTGQQRQRQPGQDEVQGARHEVHGARYEVEGDKAYGYKGSVGRNIGVRHRAPCGQVITSGLSVWLPSVRSSDRITGDIVACMGRPEAVPLACHDMPCARCRQHTVSCHGLRAHGCAPKHYIVHACRGI